MKVTVRKRQLTKGRHRLVLNYNPSTSNAYTSKTYCENFIRLAYGHASFEPEKTNNRKAL